MCGSCSNRTTVSTFNYFKDQYSLLLQYEILEKLVKYIFVFLQDDYKAYSSLRLVNPTTKMSGTYICKVSTFENEEYQERSLIIYCKYLLFYFHKEILTCQVRTVSSELVNLSLELELRPGV